jgi:hypothetical protein
MRMSGTNPAPAINIAKRIAMIRDFFENPVIKAAIQNAIPHNTLTRTSGAVGFDIPLWGGLGIVGLWSALDAFAERASLNKTRCSICGRKLCVSSRFAHKIHDSDEGQIIQELDDLRHLYAHNYAGDADNEYFQFCRHVLIPDKPAQLASGAKFNGRQVSLDLPHLQIYSQTVQNILERCR